MSGTLIRLTLKRIVKTAFFLCSARLRPFSRLIPVSDLGKWVIGREMREISFLASKLGIKIGSPWLAVHGSQQAVFIGNHFALLLSDNWFQSNHRLATAYFHGKPGQGVSEFDRCFDSLGKRHKFIHRVQVSCKEMQQVVLSSGIDHEKVHLIPIGINLDYFYRQTAASRRSARDRFNVPQNAFVVGSFQKDGDGWGEGLKPKMIKGPDVFIEAMSLLKKSVKSLVVLLSGPARGYVKEGLQAAGVPYIHHQLEEYSDVGCLYQALDVYVVASREEGGPKSVLESMASGVPLVSTRVGQATDLMKHEANGFLADIEDANEIARWATHVFEKGSALLPMIHAGRVTAERNCYNAQLPLWEKFFDGFVE
ncbi:MAG: glycosyltransferase family 4 protein [Pseudomonadota bacterium]